MKLCDIYRANDVTRWQIVKTVKPQSVAEHSFGVAMIADRLGGQILAGTGYRADCILWALHHDLPEVFTGDIATPVKQHIKKTSGENAFTALELEVGGHEYQSIYNEANITHPEIAAVVKLADLIEAMKFLDQNAVTEHGDQIREKLGHAFVQHIKDCFIRWPDYRWDFANMALHEIAAEETHMDDLV